MELALVLGVTGSMTWATFGSQSLLTCE